MDHLAMQVEESINWLSSIGADPAGGISRLLYDDNWLIAQKGLEERFQQIGLQTSFDEVGNLFGRVEGSKYPGETIMSGSHVDTVVNGGSLDGQFGIIAAYLAAKYLLETYGQPLRSLEVISMAEEEGSRFPYAFWGSKNIWGLAKKEEVIEAADAEGIAFVDAMRKSGFDFRSDADIRQDIKAFVEIHIEQGNVLETIGKPIGIVNSIVGQKRYTIKLSGEANHAGTTPMSYRKDAIYGYSKIVSHAIEKANQAGDPLVLTFGHVEVVPNTVNVVPGQVTFTMDCRHTDAEFLQSFTKELEADMQATAAEQGLTIEIDLWMDEQPVPMSDEIVQALIAACNENKLDYKLMHSGAGHDSQIFAQFVPTAMLFVPSIAGISHNPAEATELSDLVEGVKALIVSLYKLAYED
ncbi:allantoate deiminase [Enterococcus pallens]|uniref:Allantoate amidohydrolase n=1 Tax=Enterococcus pallens ATCC BAA-351 TaxID=1158607 RepID=R2QED1_9ENTE|nr:allantoate deiminase [Enterococcus pallens]EOH93598.1 allantoate amidohydrolase [Enterococcus pallens ATCC BAA-351]EOU24438.1 allantoate amidohydrolase [Enterococcus pallens ATCC BAA-351]OJG77133.1 allantoate amidohydrolase [Enterococcus pallens]